MLLALSWVVLTLQTGSSICKYRSPCMSCCAMSSPQSAAVLSWLWSLLESLYGCATCVTSCVKLCCGLKPTADCVGSVSTWVGFRYRLLLNIVCNGPWATCLELPCCLLFVSASTQPGCVKGANLCKRLSILQLRAGGRSLKASRLPEFCLQL